MSEWYKRKTTADDLKMPADLSMAIEELQMFIRYYDEKLRDLMTFEEYGKWCRETAVKVYKAMIDFYEDPGYREFVKENFTAITGARYEEVDIR